MLNRTGGKDLLTHEKILSLLTSSSNLWAFFLRDNVAIQPLIRWNGVVLNTAKG